MEESTAMAIDGKFGMFAAKSFELLMLMHVPQIQAITETRSAF